MDPETSSLSLQTEYTANLFRLQCLLNEVASKHLRKTFHDLWTSETQKVWTNSPADGEELITGFGQGLHSRSQKIQKRLLAEGNCENWDLALLIDVLKSFKTAAVTQGSTSRLDGLREIRNQIAHLGGFRLKPEEFEKHWTKAANILLELGIEQVEIDHARNLKIGGEPLEDNSEPPRAQNPAAQKCTALKDEGNVLYRKQKFAEAIEVYTKAIGLEGITNKDLAILYSNRSAAHLSAGEFDEAKFDAKSCVTLSPMWFRGYYRLAKSYEAAQKYDKGLENYEMSIMLKPDSKEIRDSRDYCRIIVSRQERMDHLDPMLQVHSREHMNERIEKHLGSVMPAGLEYRITERYKKGLPVGICGEAHKYMHGLDGYKVDYEMGAKLFAQAAQKGSAEGLYNLGILTQEGKGVGRDIQEGHRLLLQAAAQDSMAELLPGSGVMNKNIGVAEAQHSLGLAYENGVGVPVSCAHALEWYQKALVNGSGFSANNIGCMYSAGRGVLADIRKALLYYKLGALKGTVRAAENVANTYLGFHQLELARSWYLYAVHLGSSVLTWRKERFGIQPEMEKSFDPVKFAKKLQEELRQTELKELATTAREDIDAGKPQNFVNYMDKARAPLVGPDKRTLLIRGIRNAIKSEIGKPRPWEAGLGNLFPKADVDLVGLKPITMKEFDEAIIDKVYEGYLLKVTVIEDAYIRASSVFLIVEDAEGAVERVFVYGWPRNGRVQEEIGYGTRLSIVNPYFRKMKDGIFAIRVDDPNMIFRHAALSDPKRCRYCGRPGSGHVPCRKCKRVFYCDKLCMKKDRKELQHELVCLKKLKE